MWWGVWAGGGLGGQSAPSPAGASPPASPPAHAFLRRPLCAGATAASSTRTDAAQMSGPMPSPSMKATIGWSGTCSLPWVIVIFSPAGIFTRAAAMRLLLAEKLRESVQGGARLEPADLLVVHGVEALDRDRLASRLVDDDLHRLARGEPRQPAHPDPVRRAHPRVAGGLCQ